MDNFIIFIMFILYSFIIFFSNKTKYKKSYILTNKPFANPNNIINKFIPKYDIPKYEILTCFTPYSLKHFYEKIYIFFIFLKNKDYFFFLVPSSIILFALSDL